MTEDQRHDDRETLEAEAFTEEDAGDPTAAFEALRETVEDLAADLGREMTTIRKGVETAFDQFERQTAPIDYSADLGRMTQQLAQVAERLHGIEQTPVLRQGAEHYVRALERSGESLVRTAAQQFQNESRDFQRIARELAEHTASAWERRQQNRWLAVAGFGGLLAGVVLTLFLPAMLPGSTGLRVAGIVAGQSYWSAGQGMMRMHNASRFNDFLYADELVQANADAVAACYEKAQQSKKDQSCTITVTAPAQDVGQ